MAAHAVLMNRGSVFSALGQFINCSTLLQFANKRSKLCVNKLVTIRLLQPRSVGNIIRSETIRTLDQPRNRVHTQNVMCYQFGSQDPTIPGLGDSYSFSTVKYPITKDQANFLNSPGNKVLALVMNRCHALLRLLPKDTAKAPAVMIGGSPEQIRIAKQLLEYYLPGSLERKRVDEKDKASKEIHTGDQKLIWEGYIRNYKGQLPPKKTRKKCIRGKYVGTGNPCPVCKFLIEDENHSELSKVDYKDVDLIKQFISEQSGKIIDFEITGLCQRRQKEVTAAIEKAKEYGLIPFAIPGPRDEPKPFRFAGVPYKVRHKT